jgi:hypothetical protein
MNEEEAIRQFLGDRPEAEQLREWRETLEHRLEALEKDRQRASADVAPAMDAKITQLKRQIAALLEEEAITQFVQDSVRVTLAMGAASEGMEEYEE